MKDKDLVMLKRYFESLGFKITGFKFEKAVSAFQECVFQLSDEEKTNLPDDIKKKLIELGVSFEKKVEEILSQKKEKKVRYTLAQSFVDSMQDGLTSVEWEKAACINYDKRNNKKSKEVKRWGSSVIISTLIACGWIRKENNKFYKIGKE